MKVFARPSQAGNEADWTAAATQLPVLLPANSPTAETFETEPLGSTVTDTFTVPDFLCCV